MKPFLQRSVPSLSKETTSQILVWVLEMVELETITFSIPEGSADSHKYLPTLKTDGMLTYRPELIFSVELNLPERQKTDFLLDFFCRCHLMKRQKLIQLAEENWQQLSHLQITLLDGYKKTLTMGIH